MCHYVTRRCAAASLKFTDVLIIVPLCNEALCLSLAQIYCCAHNCVIWRGIVPQLGSKSKRISELWIIERWVHNLLTFSSRNLTFSNAHSLTYRFQWPRGLRRSYPAAHLLRLWVGIPPELWILSIVSVVCCQVEVSATNWSLVQRSPTDCGESCMIYRLRECPTLGRFKKTWNLTIRHVCLSHKAFILHDHICEEIKCLVGFIVLAVRTSNPARSWLLSNTLPKH